MPQKPLIRRGGKSGERCKTKNVKRRNAETDGIDPGRTAEQGLPDFGGGEFPAAFGLFGPGVRVVQRTKRVLRLDFSENWTVNAESGPPAKTKRTAENIAKSAERNDRAFFALIENWCETWWLLMDAEKPLMGLSDGGCGGSGYSLLTGLVANTCSLPVKANTRSAPCCPDAKRTYVRIKAGKPGTASPPEIAVKTRIKPADAPKRAAAIHIP